MELYWSVAAACGKWAIFIENVYWLLANVIYVPPLLQIRHRFGLYDEITISNGQKTRQCNWIRFLKVIDSYGPQVSVIYTPLIKCHTQQISSSRQVNTVCTKVKGEPIYEIVKPIPMHQEIIVYFLPERPEESFFFSRMRNTFYRQTMDSILEGELLSLPLSGGTTFFCSLLLPNCTDRRQYWVCC